MIQDAFRPLSHTIMDHALYKPLTALSGAPSFTCDNPPAPSPLTSSFLQLLHPVSRFGPVRCLVIDARLPPSGHANNGCYGTDQVPLTPQCLLAAGRQGFFFARSCLGKMLEWNYMRNLGSLELGAWLLAGVQHMRVLRMSHCFTLVSPFPSYLPLVVVVAVLWLCLVFPTLKVLGRGWRFHDFFGAQTGARKEDFLHVALTTLFNNCLPWHALGPCIHSLNRNRTDVTGKSVRIF